MEFLKSLNEALELGVTKEDFVKIWEQEIKLKQQQEESRQLELKLACGKTEEQHFQSFQQQLQSFKDKVRSMLDNSQKELHQELSELKRELSDQIKVHFQALSKQLESQAAATAVVIRNELELVLAQHGVNTQYAFGGFQQPTTGRPGAGAQKTDGLQHQKPKRDHNPPSSWQACESFSDGSDEYVLPFPSEDGAMLYVRDVDRVVSDNSITKSSIFILPECPCKVQLLVWFDKKSFIRAQLSVSGEQALKVARIFTITGHIQNRNSLSFSPLFEGTSPPLRKFKSFKEIHVNTSVCLITGKGSFEDITYSDLEKKSFVIDDTLVIKWFVTSEEVEPE